MQNTELLNYNAKLGKAEWGLDASKKFTKTMAIIGPATGLFVAVTPILVGDTSSSMASIPLWAATCMGLTSGLFITGIAGSMMAVDKMRVKYYQNKVKKLDNPENERIA